MDLGAFFDEEEKRLLAQTRALMEKERNDPAYQAAILAKIAEAENAPEPAPTPVSPCGSCGQETDDEDLDENGDCPDCAVDES